MSKSRRVFQAIDLDRTLFNTRKLEEVSYALIATLHPRIAKHALQESARNIKAGTSFFIFRFLREHLTKQEYSNYITELKEATQPEDFRLEGAVERIVFAKSKPEWSAGIVTYGLPEDQLLKVELAGFVDELPMLSTNTPDKGRVIGAWQQSDGRFLLPQELGGGYVEWVTLDDDKPEAFVHLPAQCYGVLVTGKSVTVSKGIPEYTQPVAVVETLHDSITYLRKLLAS